MNELWTVKRPWLFEKKELKASTVQVSKEVWESGLKQELVLTKRVNHINKKDIAIASRKVDSARPVKRGARVSLGSYDSRTHCLFCGTVTTKKDPKRKSDERIFYAKTNAFVPTILLLCKTRGDEWATAVQSRIDYFRGDIHATDCVYHQSCSINFCTMRNIPR